MSLIDAVQVVEFLKRRSEKFVTVGNRTVRDHVLVLVAAFKKDQLKKNKTGMAYTPTAYEENMEVISSTLQVWVFVDVLASCFILFAQSVQEEAVRLTEAAARKRLEVEAQEKLADTELGLLRPGVCGRATAGEDGNEANLLEALSPIAESPANSGPSPGMNTMTIHLES